MSGPIFGSSPWGRTAVAQLAHQHPETVASIEAAIPDGHHISIGAARKPGDWTAALVDDRPTHPVEVARAVHHVTVASACWAVLYEVGVLA